MNFQQLKDAVGELIQDASLEPSYGNHINDAYYKAVDICDLPLRKFASVDTVLATAYASVSVTTGISTRLLKAKNASTAASLLVYSTLDEFWDDFPDLTVEGSLTAVCLEDTVLWYANIPSTVTAISLLLKAYPDPLEDASDTPTAIPVHLQRQILVYGAAWLLYEILEQDEEQKVNSASMYNLSFNRRNPDSGINLLFNHIAKMRYHHAGSYWNV
ncbi:MAG: hypothetical protein WC319_10345 [Candidatus Paceibacterota bacterium]|jgi:hypothetical protein